MFSYFYVRTQCGTTCRCTSALCEWRTWRGRCGRWTRWSTTDVDPRGAAQRGKTMNAPPAVQFLCRVTHIYSLSLYIYLSAPPNPYLYLLTSTRNHHHHHRPIFDWWGDNISPHHNLHLYSFSFDFDSLSSCVRPVHIYWLILFLRWPLEIKVDPSQKLPSHH